VVPTEDWFGRGLRPWRRAYAVVAVLFMAVFVAWRRGHWLGEEATRAFIDLSSTAAPLAAAAIAAWRAQALPAERRLAWRLLGAGCLAWGLGNIAWTYHELVLKVEVPFPSLADVGYVLLIPFAAAALLSMVVGTTAPTARLRTLVDGLFIAGSLLFIARALLRPLWTFAGQQDGLLAQALALAYPLGDVMLLALLVVVATRVPAAYSRTLLLLGAALACLTVADVGYWYLTALGTYETGSWADGGWVAAFLLVGYTALRPIPPATAAAGSAPPGFAVTVLPLLPWIAATVVAIAVQATVGYLEPALFWIAIVTIALVTLRQFLIIAENVQLRRAAESALRRLQDQQAERTLMLNTVTHDIMSPLTSARIQLHLLERRVGPDEKAAHSIHIVDRNVDQVGRLARDLKDLANLEAGHFRIDATPIDLAQLARNVVDSFQDLAQQAGLALRLQDDGPLPCLGDRHRLDQVLYNLVSNAIRYTREGEVVVWCHRRGDRAAVAVRDTGRGLEPDEVARLFRPFSQVHGREEAREKGTGLGLFISRSIAEAHGGTLHVESAGRGKGSTFFLEVPLAAAAPPAATPPAPGQPAAPGH
jgi:signal transduction histidine kinase